jgi:hypothetical protein
MPTKSQKVGCPPADDFDDIFADAKRSNAIITTIITTTTSTTSSSSSSSTYHAEPTDNEMDLMINKLCIAGDLVRLRRYLIRGGMAFSACALCDVVASNRLNIVRFLIKEYGADVSQTSIGLFRLVIATQRGFVTMVRCLVIELGAYVSQANGEGFTALFVAAQEGCLAVMECLVKELGAEVNQAMNDGPGSTLLCIAAQNGNKEMVVYLVEELGADVNKAALHGETPLMLASSKKHEKIVRYLLKNGADAQASAYGLDGTAANISKWYGASAEQTAYLEARTYCAKSGCSGAGLKKCANCREFFFCSKDCQVAAWPAHKADCKRCLLGAKAGKRN